MKKISSLLLLLLVGCAIPKITPQKILTPEEKRQIKIDRCIHRYVDKGVKFSKSVLGCNKYIYFKTEER